MWTNALRNCIIVAVGAAALVTVVKLEVTPARAGVVIDDDPLGAAPPPSTPPSTASGRKKGTPAPAPTPPKDPPKVAAPTLALLATPGAAAGAPAGVVEAAALLTVPDFKGKRLSVAMRDARKLGLVVSGTDDGERIRADEASGYRVRRMLTKPGTEVEPGTVIKVAVREVVSMGQGY
jgi:hypothetical protein